MLPRIWPLLLTVFVYNAAAAGVYVCTPWFQCTQHNTVAIYGNQISIIPRVNECPSNELCCLLPDGETPKSTICSGPAWTTGETPEEEQPSPHSSQSVPTQSVVDSGDTKVDEGPVIAAIVPSNRTGCGIKRISPLSTRFGPSDLGRRDTLYGEYPWMVAIYRKIDGFWEYICVGSLIADDTVLTAAHCLEDSDGEFWPEDLRIVAGDWDLESEREPSPAQTVEVSELIIHDDFSRGNLVHDIALIRLQTPVVLGSFVDIICLMPEFNGTNARCTAAGWAPLKDHDGIERKILTQVQVPLVDHDECESLLKSSRLGPYFRLHSSFLCAGAAKRDTCKGDGGGPLMCLSPEKRMVQVGIVSWGVDCGSGLPGVYANVPMDYDWIKKHANMKLTTSPADE